MEWVRQHRWTTALAALAGLVLGAIVAVVVFSAHVAPRAATGVRRIKLAAAGDICGSCAGTSNEVIARNPGLVLTLGDNAYDSGSLAEYNSKYDPYWGRFKAKTVPSPGNHEWNTANAQGYRDYFGFSDTEPLYGSFTRKGWHFVRLDTEQLSSSQQENWMASDLAADTHQCEVVYGHHPPFSSGSTHGNTSELTNAWNIATAAGVDIWLAGHEHQYERISRDNIKEFVVGTGGAGSYPFGTPVLGSEFRWSGGNGVIFLTLKSDGTYSWRFRDTSQTLVDSGSGVCH